MLFVTIPTIKITINCWVYYQVSTRYVIFNFASIFYIHLSLINIVINNKSASP